MSPVASPLTTTPYRGRRASLLGNVTILSRCTVMTPLFLFYTFGIR